MNPALETIKNEIEDAEATIANNKERNKELAARVKKLKKALALLENDK